MKRPTCFAVWISSCLVLAIGMTLPLAHAEDVGYLWPIDKLEVLSSVFADHRHFRFHSGIDIPTGGKTGYRVLACQSGWVYRVFVSWNGYGKAVYLKLDDGRFAVYGHLSQFSEEIADLVVTRQLEEERYHQDLFFQEDEIRVKRGELIGYSGESGWGGPHLHFELRDSSSNPINPLTSGISVIDGIPPKMEYLAIRPLALGAKVNGSAEVKIFSIFVDGQRNVYGLDQKPLIEGEIGLELSASDRMENSKFDLGIYAVELSLDGDLIFASRYDEISFETTHLVELDRDFELRRMRGSNFHRLYVEEGNDLPLYEPAGGVINTRTFSPGLHQLTIKASDAAGNFSTLEFDFVFDQIPSILSCAFEDDGSSQKVLVGFDDPDDPIEQIIVETSSLDTVSWQSAVKERIDKRQGERSVILTERIDEPALLGVRLKDSLGAFSERKYLVVNADQLPGADSEDSLGLNLQYSFKDNLFIFDLRFSQILKGVPALSLKFGGLDFDPLFIEQVEATEYTAVFPFFLHSLTEMTLAARGVTQRGDSVTLEETLPVAIISRSHGGMGISSDGGARVEMGPDVVYSDVNVRISKLGLEFEATHRPLGKIYAFEPSTVPFNGRARISLSYPDEGCDPHRLGLYQMVGERDWRFVGQELDTINKVVGGKVRYLSSYALLEDTLPPTIAKVSLRSGSRIKSRKPKITAVVNDDLSGIEDDLGIEIRIDGEWMIPEYDVEEKILSTRPHSPLAPGRHLLSIRARDRAGNEAATEREFFVVGK